MSTKLTEFENAQVGMWVGIIEVLCLQPFNYAKNMIQQGQPLTLNPAKLYRGSFLFLNATQYTKSFSRFFIPIFTVGVGANVVNMGSCTMIQFAVGGSVKKAILGDDKSRKLLVHEEMGAGIFAGIISALVGSPLELIMIRQQRRGLNTIDTVKDILTQSPANIGRGYLGAAVREGLWTCGYLSIPPIMRAELTTRFPETFDSQAKARVPASLLGGLFACYLTHPFDTVKTCMQGDIERAKFGTFTQTAKVVYGESGFFGFYRGKSLLIPANHYIDRTYPSNLTLYRCLL
jgi:hypothetical protein